MNASIKSGSIKSGSINSASLKPVLVTDLSFDQQRQALRRQMLAQRQLINYQLGPPARAINSGYPRSATMRFLTQRPALVSKLLAEAAALLLGARFLKSMSGAISFAKFVRSTAK